MKLPAPNPLRVVIQLEGDGAPCLESQSHATRLQVRKPEDTPGMCLEVTEAAVLAHSSRAVAHRSDRVVDVSDGARQDARVCLGSQH